MITTTTVRTTAAVIAAVVMLAACSAGSATHPARAAASTPSASPTPTVPPGCLRATTVLAAVRTRVEQSPSDVSESALKQLQSMAKALPAGQLRVDVDRAALDLALFREHEALGGPVAKTVKAFAADLDKITAECS